MTSNAYQYQGDPRLILTDSGVDIQFIDGQPVMDRGFENAVLISLFTRKGWFGNTLLRDKNQQVGSDYEAVASRPITRSSLNDVRSAAERALKWMTDTGLASEIIVRAINPGANLLQVSIIIVAPNKDTKQLMLVKNGQNWIAQAQDPASERLQPYNMPTLSNQGQGGEEPAEEPTEEPS
jgi:phage gp46-like protein